jgi:hypothetical protein
MQTFARVRWQRRVDVATAGIRLRATASAIGPPSKSDDGFSGCQNRDIGQTVIVGMQSGHLKS